MAIAEGSAKRKTVPTLLTFTEYAAHRGVTRPYVSQLVSAGKIPVRLDASNRRLIDPVAADAALARASDPGKYRTTERHAKARAASAASAGDVDIPDDDDDALSDPITAPAGGFAEARTVTEQFRAKVAEIEYRKLAGQLVEVARVKRAIGDNAASARRTLERMPDRIASRLAAESDVRKVYALLAAEIALACNEIADAARTLPAQLSSTEQ
jgi:hypothetical protein